VGRTLVIVNRSIGASQKRGRARGVAGVVSCEGATGAFFDPYILLSNPNPSAATADVVFTTDDGRRYTRRKTLAPLSRLTINIEEDVPVLANVAAVSTRVATLFDEVWQISPPIIVESTNNVPINVESAIYWSANGVAFEGGGNTGATRLR
jgi:hypothetical protein